MSKQRPEWPQNPWKQNPWFESVAVAQERGAQAAAPAHLRRARRGLRAGPGDRGEPGMDGGVRRGSDVVKAVALGARAVMIGRTYLWGLAANGQAGVENVLDVIRSGIDSTLLGMGLSSIQEVGPEHLLIPDDFILTVGK